MAVVEIIAANLVNKTEYEIKKKNACAYCRVSTDNEEQLNSYNSQIKHYSSMIKNNPDLNFVGIYADEGISGTQMKKRDEFLKMIEDAKKGKIDLIIAKSISRFARNTVDTLNTVRLLRNLNVDVYFEKENIHTLNMDSEMFLTLYSAFAQAESESTSMNVKLGLRAKMKRGEACGGIKCYGYDYNKITKELTINEEQAKVVNKIFDYYISGLGTSRLARKLEEDGIPSPSGGKTWHAGVLKGILRNVKYIGDVLGQKWYVEDPLTHKEVINYGQKPKYYSKGHHVPIIDKEKWDKVQEIYGKRSEILKPGGKYYKKYSMRYTYSGKIECGICKHNYVKRNSRYIKADGQKHHKVYWKCSEYVYNSNKCNASKGIREEELNKMFVTLFNHISENHNYSEESLIQKIEKALYKHNGMSEINKLEEELEKTKKKMSYLLDLKLEDQANEELYSEKEIELKQKINTLKEKISENNKTIVDKEQTQKRIDNIKKIIKETKKLTEFNDDIFKKIIEKIIVGDITEDGTKDYSVIRFVLKTGEVAKFENNINNEKIMSFEHSERIHQSKQM